MLPHFDVSSFPSQILWLAIAVGLSYVFNKFFFMPNLFKAIDKREKLIRSCLEDSEKMNIHIESVKSEIDELMLQAKKETMRIIDDATKKSQDMLLKQMQRNNEEIMLQTNKHEEYLRNQKTNLEANIHIIVTDIKNKVSQFITRQNVE